MLVLSRKQNQRIVFPNLGISVEVLRIVGKAVRVGVEAPRDVRVLRDELAAFEEPDALDDAKRKRRHEFRNKLHTAQLALHLLQKQLDAGRFADAEQTLERALKSFTELDAAAAGQAADSHDVQPGPVRRALVVEDNANERELLAGYLRLCGYQVDTVGDGLAAMDYLSDHDPPDVVLLDMQMPRMDGPKTIAAIRCNPDFQGIKVFAVSGSERSDLHVPLGEQGVDGWFCKPLQPAEFAGQLDEKISREHTAA